MLFDRLSWADVERYLGRDDRVVLITGACEQHAHLSLMADVLLPGAIALEAARREGVLVAPPIPFGISPSFAAYPGTISLRPETFAAVVRDVVAGLLAQGFRRVLVSNGHGGNTGVLIPLLVELAGANPSARLEHFQWWTHPAVVAVAQEAGLVQHHANWSEDFACTRVGPAPEAIKPEPAVSRTASATATRAALGDGSYGGPYRVDDRVTQRMFEVAVEAMVTALRDLRG